MRGLSLLRALADAPPHGLRMADLAAGLGMPRPSAHRLLKLLVQERMVEFSAETRRYRLGIDFFVLASRAGSVTGIREACRATLLRLTATLGETIFLLVRNGYEAVCIDRSAGPLPIRSFTGDIGGRVMLGIGQGATAILGFLPRDEQDEIIARNLPRMQELGDFDEATLRGKLAEVRELGYCDRWGHLIPGMAGVGVPILTAQGYPIAALSIGTTTDRLTEGRSLEIARILQGEATRLTARINPFDPALRRASAAMEMAAN